MEDILKFSSALVFPSA